MVSHRCREYRSASPVFGFSPLASEDNCLYTHHVRFEWDLSKSRSNLRVHGVSFAEAATVLEDDFALTRMDPDVVD